MAPPLPLSTVAGTLALSFTAGRAAPTSAPVQDPVSVPSPPSLPPLPGETQPTPEEPEPTTDVVAVDPTAPVPDAPEPEPTVAPPPIQAQERERERPEGSSGADDAEDERLLRSNRRPLMFTLFAGSARAIRGGYSFLNDFKLEGAIGGFGSRFRTGGFVVVQMTKGLPFTTFTLAPRLSLNRQIVPNHAFYFTTNITVGYRASTYRDSYTSVYDGYGYGGGGGSDRVTYHSAVMGVSWGASAIIAERLLLSFRPVDLELVAPAASEELIQLNWSVMAGLGVVWGGPGDNNR